MRRLGSVPKLVLIITNRFVSVPHVADQDRLLIEPLTVPGFYHVVARYGYMEVIVQDKEFVTGITTQLRALLSDALHGLSNAALTPAAHSTLSAAVAELNAAPLFTGEAIAESKHASDLTGSSEVPSSGGSQPAAAGDLDALAHGNADALVNEAASEPGMAKAESMPVHGLEAKATFTAISMPQATTARAPTRTWRGCSTTLPTMPTACVVCVVGMRG